MQCGVYGTMPQIANTYGSGTLLQVENLPQMVAASAAKETNYLDITNGARGIITDIILHPEEPPFDQSAPVVKLRHLPAYILVKLNRTRASQLAGLDEAVIQFTASNTLSQPPTPSPTTDRRVKPSPTLWLTLRNPRQASLRCSTSMLRSHGVRGGRRSDFCETSTTICLKRCMIHIFWLKMIGLRS